jgi:hypothetical protein
MDTSLVEPSVATELMLRVTKDALWRYRRSSTRRLLGLVRGLELGVSELGDSRAVSCGSITPLQQRVVRLARSNNDYYLGVAIGITVAIGIYLATSNETNPPPSA